MRAKYSELIQMAAHLGNPLYILHHTKTHCVMVHWKKVHFPLLLTHCYRDTSPRPCVILLPHLPHNLHDAAGSRCDSVSYHRGDSEVNNVESQTHRTPRSSVWRFGKPVVLGGGVGAHRRWALGTSSGGKNGKRRGGEKTFFSQRYRKEAVLATVCFLKRTEY